MAFIGGTGLVSYHSILISIINGRAEWCILSTKSISGEVSRAIGKLHKKLRYLAKKVKEWLAKQALWQVHIPVPREYIHRAHFTQSNSTSTNMPHLLTYKYILTGIDVASRYKVAKPLRTKKASDVAFLLKNIYESKANPLKWPEVFQCDKGSWV